MALGKVFGNQPRISLALVEHLGSASAVFELSASARNDLLEHSGQFRGMLGDDLPDEAERDYNRLSGMGATCLAYTEASYPTALRDCPDAPVCLYVRSATQPDLLFAPERPVIAVVGTRDVSPYGMQQCGRLVRALSAVEPSPVVVSGLAYGVDICAHRTAMECGLPTLAVMATGVDAVYPRQHRADAARMAERPGCALLSDYPLGTAPVALHFIRRNRIIAALSRAVLLVESKEKGGGLITARQAFGYGREVYAVPGRMDDVRSQGCNRLIAESVAEAVSSPEAWLASLGLKASRPAARTQVNASSPVSLSRIYEGRLRKEYVELAARMLLCIQGECGIDVRQLSDRLQCPQVLLSSLLALMEADGLIVMDLAGRCRINA